MWAWAPMGFHGHTLVYPWVPVGTQGTHGLPSEYRWVPIGTHGHVPMGSHGNPWETMGAHEYSWGLGCPLFLMGIRGYNTAIVWTNMGHKCVATWATNVLQNGPQMCCKMGANCCKMGATCCNMCPNMSQNCEEIY